VPIAISPEQRALQASIREWAHKAGTIELVRRLEPGSLLRAGSDEPGDAAGSDEPGDLAGSDEPEDAAGSAGTGDVAGSAGTGDAAGSARTGDAARSARTGVTTVQEEHWNALAGLSIFSIALPAAVGGADGTVADLAAALEQLTYALVPGPVMPTLLAGLLLRDRADLPAAKELLPALAAGQASVAVGLTAAPLTGTWLADGTLRGEITWCQLFSEPDAGSDLAAVRTSALRAAGGWQLTGQKVWTSLAHEADWAICLARTDPEAPKHRGLTYFLVDMHSTGIDIRPLREITGRATFNEVFLDGVFVPDDCVVGECGDGWRSRWHKPDHAQRRGRTRAWPAPGGGALVDFSLEETQEAVIEAATAVLGQHRPPSGLPQDDYDRALWKELGQAGLLGLAIPEWFGGGGLGVLDTATLLNTRCAWTRWSPPRSSAPIEPTTERWPTSTS
jgi:alkylation response protein AidB-like acyl-CoA dehydrogenase